MLIVLEEEEYLNNKKLENSTDPADVEEKVNPVRSLDNEM